jgi:hypothetical protein
MLTVAALTPYRLAALHLLETADLDVVPTRTGWAITDPEQPAATALIASGDTLAAAIDAALPVALADGYLTAAAVELLDGPAEPDECWRCNGCGEGATERHTCTACRGSGVEQVAS